MQFVSSHLPPVLSPPSLLATHIESAKTSLEAVYSARFWKIVCRLVDGVDGRQVPGWACCHALIRIGRRNGWSTCPNQHISWRCWRWNIEFYSLLSRVFDIKQILLIAWPKPAIKKDTSLEWEISHSFLRNGRILSYSNVSRVWAMGI